MQENAAAATEQQPATAIDWDHKFAMAECYHEADHAAVAWWFREGFHDCDLFMTGKQRGRVGGFSIPGLSDKTLQLILSACDNPVSEEKLRSIEERPLKVRAIEKRILRLLGGPLAEVRYMGYNFDITKRAFRLSSEYRDPGSDSSRLRNLLRALTGKDDKAYQIRLQRECQTIVGEPRTWQAIQVIGEHLMRVGAMSGEDAEAVFRSTGSPQTESW